MHAVLGGLLALGGPACRPEVSLDAAGTPTGGSTDTGGSSTEAGGGSTDTGEGEPPPEVCDAACTPLLLPTWSHEGPSGTLMVIEMLRDEDGSLVLGLQRVDGGLGLVRLSSEGEPLWSAAPGLPCDTCELEGIALHPSGDIIVSATSPATPPAPVPGDPEPPLPAPGTALLARFDVAAGQWAWIQSFALAQGPDTRPRAGEVVVLDEDRITLAILDGNSEGEVLRLRDLRADGTLRTQLFVALQPSPGQSHLPLLTASPTGEVHLAHDWWDPDTEEHRAATWRLIPPQYALLSHTPIALPLDDLAADSAGHRLELSHTRGEQSVTLRLTSWQSAGPEQWTTTLPLVTTSDARPALAIGPDDDVYAAARATPRLHPADPYVVMLEVARWSASGVLRWHARRPLDMMATVDPLELVVGEDDSLVVGTVVQGRLRVAYYEQACICP